MAIPLRTCCGCRQKKTVHELQRITLQPPAELRLDGKRKENGRGVYLCLDRTCLNLALRKKAFCRLFRRNLPADSLADLNRRFLAKLTENEDL